MEILTELQQNRFYLQAIIHRSLVENALATYKMCHRLGNNPQEPDFIANLVLKWPRAFYNILRSILSPKIRIGITGIYCHQKPIADIGSNPNPEIGDLLFVYKHVDQYNKSYFNSILFQAKCTQSEIYTISNADLHQLNLYQDWPQFSYRRAGKLNGQSRNIYPKNASCGAQYLLIDNNFYSSVSSLKLTYPFGCAIANRNISISNDLTNELIDFLLFKTGRAIGEQDRIGDDWSKMIWDLLTISTGKASNRKNAGLSNFPRRPSGDFDGCFFIKGVDDDSIFDNLKKINPEIGRLIEFSFENDESGGVSVFYIESKVSEDFNDKE